MAADGAAAPLTAAVGTDVALDAPNWLVAVTVTRIACPISLTRGAGTGRGHRSSAVVADAVAAQPVKAYLVGCSTSPVVATRVWRAHADRRRGGVRRERTAGATIAVALAALLTNGSSPAPDADRRAHVLVPHGVSRGSSRRSQLPPRCCTAATGSGTRSDCCSMTRSCREHQARPGRPRDRRSVDCGGSPFTTTAVGSRRSPIHLSSRPSPRRGGGGRCRPSAPGRSVGCAGDVAAARAVRVLPPVREDVGRAHEPLRRQLSRLASRRWSA